MRHILSTYACKRASCKHTPGVCLQLARDQRYHKRAIISNESTRHGCLRKSPATSRERSVFFCSLVPKQRQHVTLHEDGKSCVPIRLNCNVQCKQTTNGQSISVSDDDDLHVDHSLSVTSVRSSISLFDFKSSLVVILNPAFCMNVQADLAGNG
jgi:hypothetical protein